MRFTHERAEASSQDAHTEAPFARGAFVFAKRQFQRPQQPHRTHFTAGRLNPEDTRPSLSGVDFCREMQEGGTDGKLHRCNIQGTGNT